MFKSCKVKNHKSKRIPHTTSIFGFAYAGLLYMVVYYKWVLRQQGLFYTMAKIPYKLENQNN